MNITVTGRHMELTDALRSHVESEVGRLQPHLSDASKADVVLWVERHHHIAEVNMNSNGLRLHSREASEDMYQSVDAAVSKLERQVRKFKERINSHKPRNGEKHAQDYGHQIIEASPESNGHAAADAGHRVVHHERIPMKPMTVDEAVFQLELVDDLFLVFINADNSMVNVLYKRSNGSYGLIEPKY